MKPHWHGQHQSLTSAMHCRSSYLCVMCYMLKTEITWRRRIYLWNILQHTSSWWNGDAEKTSPNTTSTAQWDAMMKISRHRSPQQVLSNTMRSVYTVPSWTRTNTPRGSAHCDALTKINCHHPPQQVLLDLECHRIARHEIWRQNRTRRCHPKSSQNTFKWWILLGWPENLSNSC